MSKFTKIEQTKTLLEQALKILTADNSLHGVRIGIKRAIESLYTEQKKRSNELPPSRADEIRKQWNYTLQSIIPSPGASNALNKIEQMIGEEQDKLKELETKKSESKQATLLG